MKIKLDWEGNIGFSASTRGFSNIMVDEPPKFHGDDRGPSSIEYLGIGIGGCLGTSFSYCLQRMEIPTKHITIELDVDMHHVDEEGINPLRITKIDADIQVTLENEEDEDDLGLCIDSFKKYCVVTKSIMNGIPVDITVKKKD